MVLGQERKEVKNINHAIQRYEMTEYEHYFQKVEADIRAKERRIGSIFDLPIIKGCKPILNQQEKLEQSKPHNKADYERQFSKNKKNEEWKKNW